MKSRLGCVSATGIAVAVVALVGVAAWTALAGPVAFSPGALSASTRGGATLGGVTSHAQLGARCGACHTAPWSSQTMADKCLACHAQVAGQLQSRTGLHGRLLAGRSPVTCKGCHTDHLGAAGALTVANGATFPHDLTGYSLSGHRATIAGARVTCAECHPAGLARFDQTTCTSCHESLDAAFMRKHEAAFGTHCLTCHNGRDNFGRDFNHNRFAFKLTGKHAGVACEQCHSNTGSLSDLKNTPQDCYSCHVKNDPHAGKFGTMCGQCHTPASWKGATFDHSVFPVNHGTEQQASNCQTCHPNGVSTYTCLGCHAHTPASVAAGHEGRTLAEISDCVRCHAGGRGGGD